MTQGKSLGFGSKILFNLIKVGKTKGVVGTLSEDNVSVAFLKGLSNVMT